MHSPATIRSPFDGYMYAKFVVKGPCPEAEDIIKMAPYWAIYYAKDVIKDRWYGAEEIISKSEYVHMYVLIVAYNEVMNDS